MKKSVLLVSLLVVLLIAAWSISACNSPAEDPDITEPQNGQEPADPDENNSVEEPADGDEVPDWDETIEGTVIIEGMEESMTLHLFEGEDFITYVPEDMIAETEEINGKSYRFFAAFGGEKVQEAYLRLHFFPEEFTEVPSIEEVEDELGLEGFSFTRVSENEHAFSWSLKEFTDATHPEFSASGYIGKTDNQYFVAFMHYPLEFGDGFFPRASTILEHVTWLPSMDSLSQV